MDDDDAPEQKRRLRLGLERGKAAPRHSFVLSLLGTKLSAANPPLASGAHDTRGESAEEAWRLADNLAAVDEERRPCLIRPMASQRGATMIHGQRPDVERDQESHTLAAKSRRRVFADRR